MLKKTSDIFFLTNIYIVKDMTTNMERPEWAWLTEDDDGDDTILIDLCSMSKWDSPTNLSKQDNMWCM